MRRRGNGTTRNVASWVSAFSGHALHRQDGADRGGALLLKSTFAHVSSIVAAAGKGALPLAESAICVNDAICRLATVEWSAY